MDEKIGLVFDPDNERAAAYVRDRLSMFNSSQTGKSDYYPCYIFLRGEKNETLGGLLGYVWSDWLFISTLWVDEALRGKGHATRLMDAAGDRIGEQLLVPLAPGRAAIDLVDAPALGVDAVGVDAGERADAAGRGPGARAFAVRDRDPLPALDERQDLASGNDERLEADRG